jgi:hypothetical protein
MGFEGVGECAHGQIETVGTIDTGTGTTMKSVSGWTLHPELSPVKNWLRADPSFWLSAAAISPADAVAALTPVVVTAYGYS